jgi:hypothetical protein
VIGGLRNGRPFIRGIEAEEIALRDTIGLVLASGFWFGMAGESRAQSPLMKTLSPPYGSASSMSGLPYGASDGTIRIMGGSSTFSPGSYAGYSPMSSASYGGASSFNGYSYGSYSASSKIGFRPFRNRRRNYR